MNIDPQTMAQLMQSVGPAAGKILQGPPQQAQQPVDPMMQSPIQRGYMTDQEQQQMDPNAWRQRGNSIVYQTPQQPVPAQLPQQPGQGMGQPLDQGEPAQSPAQQLMALQSLYRRP